MDKKRDEGMDGERWGGRERWMDKAREVGERMVRERGEESRRGGMD